MKKPDRVQHLMGRSGTKPFILIADTAGTFERFAGQLDAVPRLLTDEFWPGPLTIVIRPLKLLPAHLFGPSGGVAFRVTSHPVAAELSREFGMPVVSTSANITDQKPVLNYGEAVRLFGNHADIILDNDESIAGETMVGEPSTVVDFTSSTMRFLRIGAISREESLGIF